MGRKRAKKQNGTLWAMLIAIVVILLLIVFLPA